MLRHASARKLQLALQVAIQIVSEVWTSTVLTYIGRTQIFLLTGLTYFISLILALSRKNEGTIPNQDAKSTTNHSALAPQSLCVLPVLRRPNITNKKAKQA